MWIRISDSASVICGDVGNVLLGHMQSFHFAQLELSFGSSDSVHRVTTFDVVKKSECLVGALNAHDV